MFKFLTEMLWDFNQNVKHPDQNFHDLDQNARDIDTNVWDCDQKVQILIDI